MKAKGKKYMTWKTLPVFWQRTFQNANMQEPAQHKVLSCQQLQTGCGTSSSPLQSIASPDGNLLGPRAPLAIYSLLSKAAAMIPAIQP